MSRRSVLTLLVASLLASAGDVAQAQHGARVNVGGSGDPFAPQPLVDFSQSGHGVAVYEGGGVRLATRGPSGDWTASLLGPGTHSTLAVAANGAAVVAWRESATLVRVAYRAGADDAFNLEAGRLTTANAGQVAAGIDSQGNAVVAYKDGPIRVVRSTGASFGEPEEAPLGGGALFTSGERNQLDAGPRAFRDDLGNVVLVFRDADGAVIAHRTPGGTWSKATLPGAATAVRADADPATRVLAVATKGGGRTRAFRGQTRTGAVSPTLDVAVAGDGFDVAVRQGGLEDLIVYTGPSNTPVFSVSCAEDYAPAEVAPGGNYSFVGAAITAGQAQVAWLGTTTGGTGVVRASRAPGASWAREPLLTTNGGGVGAAADFSGNAMAVNVSTDSGGATYGYPFAGGGGAAARCQAPAGTDAAGDPPGTGSPPGATPQPPPAPTPPRDDGPPRPAQVCGPSFTILQACNLPTNLPQICGPTGTILPACHFPVQLPTVCGPSFGTILQACGPSTNYVTACGGLGTILPQCNLPPRNVPVVCGPTNSILPACTGANNLITVCGPRGTIVPECAFNFTIRPVVIRLGPNEATTIDAEVFCPDTPATLVRASSAAARAAQRSRGCVGSMTADDLRLAKGRALISELRTLNEFASGDRELSDTDSPEARSDDAAFFTRGRALVLKFFNTPRDVNKPFNRASELAVLTRREGPPPYRARNLDSIQQRAGQFVVSVEQGLASVRNARRAGGRAARAPRALSAQRLDRSSSKPLRTVRFRIPAGKKRRVKLTLSARQIRTLTRGAGRQQRLLRLVVALNARPRPVVRFLDVPVRRR